MFFVYSFRWNWPFLMADDVALIELAVPLPFSASVRPVCLSAVNVTAEMPLGKGALIAGWGQLNTSTGMDSLHAARLDVAPAKDCWE